MTVTPLNMGPETEESALDCSHWLKVGRPGEFWFIHGFAQAVRGPTLELGSGGGRIAHSLARAGVTVVGLELSDPMLNKANELRELAGETICSRLTYVKGDMKDFHLDQKFGLVVVPFSTFWRHMNLKEAANCLACIKEALLPGGMFLIDTPQVCHPDYGSLWEEQPSLLGFTHMTFQYHLQDKQFGAMMIGQFRQS